MPPPDGAAVVRQRFARGLPEFGARWRDRRGGGIVPSPARISCRSGVCATWLHASSFLLVPFSLTLLDGGNCPARGVRVVQIDEAAHMLKAQVATLV